MEWLFAPFLRTCSLYRPLRQKHEEEMSDKREKSSTKTTQRCPKQLEGTVVKSARPSVLLAVFPPLLRFGSWSLVFSRFVPLLIPAQVSVVPLSRFTQSALLWCYILFCAIFYKLRFRVLPPPTRFCSHTHIHLRSTPCNALLVSDPKGV